jgi:DNA-binding transcriptional ArsR family regulator
METRIQRQPTYVTKASDIRALASAIRQDLLEAIEARGPLKVKDLASIVRRRPDALYYHLRVLNRAGFIEIDRSLTEPMISTRKRAVQLVYEPANRPHKAAVIAVVRAMVRASLRNFIKAFMPKTAVVEGPARNLWAGRVHGTLTRAELEEVNETLESLLAVFQTRKENRVDEAPLHEFTFVLAPLQR